MIEPQNPHGARRIETPGSDPVTLIFEGAPMEAYAADSVASALIAAGVRVFTTTEVSGGERGGFCFVGRCADCLVIVDGHASQRACNTPVRDGMDIRVQHGLGPAERQEHS